MAELLEVLSIINVRVENGKLEYYLNGKEDTAQMILGLAPTILIRTMDVASDILDFKKDNTIVVLFNQIKTLRDK